MVNGHFPNRSVDSSLHGVGCDHSGGPSKCPTNLPLISRGASMGSTIGLYGRSAVLYSLSLASRRLTLSPSLVTHYTAPETLINILTSSMLRGDIYANQGHFKTQQSSFLCKE